MISLLNELFETTLKPRHKGQLEKITGLVQRLQGCTPKPRRRLLKEGLDLESKKQEQLFNKGEL